MSQSVDDTFSRVFLTVRAVSGSTTVRKEYAFNIKSPHCDVKEFAKFQAIEEYRKEHKGHVVDKITVHYCVPVSILNE